MFQTQKKEFLFLGILLFCILLYSGALSLPYAVQDQMRAFRYPTGENVTFSKCFKPIFRFYVMTARPIVPVGECLEHSTIQTIAGFNFWRLLSVFIFSAILFLFSVFLQKQKYSPLLSFFISASLLMIPGLSFFVLQGGTAIFILLGALFTLFTLDRYLEKKSTKKTFWLSALCLFACFSVYPTGMFFALAMVIFLLPNKKREVQALLKLYIVTMPLYYLFYRFVIRVTWGRHAFDGSGDYTLTLTPNLFLKKIGVFIKEVLPQSLNLWSFYESPILLIICLFFIAIGFYRLYKSYLYILISIALSLSVWFASSSLGDAYRYFFPFTVLLASLFWIGFLSFLKNQKAKELASFILFLLITFQFSFITTLDTWNNALEYRYIKSKLIESKLLTSNIKQIHLIRTKKAYHYMPIRKAELNMPTMGAHPEHVYQMMNAQVRDLNWEGLVFSDCREDVSCKNIPLDKKENRRNIFVSQSENEIVTPPNTLVIDMRTLTQ